MANDIPKNLKYTPISVEGFVDVNGRLLGSSLLDCLRRTFTIDSQMDEGDYYMDRSRDLLEKHLQLMQLRDQTVIRRRYLKARDTKQELHSDDSNGSPFQKFFQARKYRLISRKAYKVIKLASDRIRDDPLIDQLAEATRPHEGQSGSDPGIASTPRNPFTDSHAIFTSTDLNVNDMDRVEISTYHDESTNNEAVVADFVAQDESVQHLVATFPTDGFSGDRTDKEASQPIASAPPTISLHRDDGSSPRFIPISLPDVSGRTADEQAETSTLNSFSRSKPVKWTLKGKCPPPPTRASVHPIDSDTYTRSIGPRIRRKYK